MAEAMASSTSSPSSSRIGDPKKAEKSIKEKERVEKIGIAFEQLGTILRRYRNPTNRQRRGSSSTPLKKLNRIQLLTLAVDVIRHLKEQLNQLEEASESPTTRTGLTIPGHAYGNSGASSTESSRYSCGSIVMPVYGVLPNHPEQMPSAQYKHQYTAAVSVAPEVGHSSSSNESSQYDSESRVEPTGLMPVYGAASDLQQNVTNPCSNDSGRSTQNLEVQEVQHTQISPTEERMSEPFIQHSLFQYNHSQQLSDAGKSQESVEGYTLDGPLWEQAGFKLISPSLVYENPIPGPSSWLTPLPSPPLPNHPNHMMMIHPLAPPMSSQHQQTHSAFVNRIPLVMSSSREPTSPFWDQGNPPPISPPGGVQGDFCMAHVSSSLHETLVPFNLQHDCLGNMKT